MRRAAVRAVAGALAFAAYNWFAPQWLREFVADLAAGGAGAGPVLASLIAGTFLSWIALNDCFAQSFALGLSVRARAARELAALLSREDRAEPLSAFLAQDLPRMQKGAESVPLAVLTLANVGVSCVLLARFLGAAGIWSVGALAAFGLAAQGLSLSLGRAGAACAEAGRRRMRLVEFMVSSAESIWAQGWRIALGETIAQARQAEARALGSVLNRVLLTQILFAAAPLAAAGAALLPGLIRTGRLDPRAVFPALMVLGLLRSAFAALPRVVAALVQGALSWSRYRALAASPRFAEADVRFRLEGLPSLDGKMVAVVGGAGSGKSACLRQLAEAAGRGKRTARLEQAPWIFQGTVAENVRALAAPDAAKLRRVLKTVELDHDLRLMGRDESMAVESQGRNLSGGQRHRLALARALYAECDLYVLDQPFAALDSAVRRRVQERLRGELAGKTVLVAGSSAEEIPEADVVIDVDKLRRSGGAR